MHRLLIAILVLAMVIPAQAQSPYDAGTAPDASGGSGAMDDGMGANSTGNAGTGSGMDRNTTGDPGDAHGGMSTGARRNTTGPAVRADQEQADAERMGWMAVQDDGRREGLDRAGRAKLFANLTAADGEASGRFVRFGYDGSTGALTDYEAAELNTTFFTLVHAEQFAAPAVEVHGAVFRMADVGASIAVHNNPTAELDVRGTNLTLHVDLAPGVTAGNISGNRTIKLGAANGQHGHLVLVGNGAVRTTAGGFAFDLVDGGVLFLAHPAGTVVGSALHDVIGQATLGKMGAIGSYVGTEGGALGETTSWTVQMRVQQSRDDRLVLDIASDDPAGKALVLRTDTTSVPAARAEDVVVALDGVPVPRARDALDAIVNGTQGAQGRVFVALEGAGIQVVVGVPHFSAYALAISSATSMAPELPPAGSDGNATGQGAAKGTPGFEVAPLLGMLGLLAVLRRRRD